LEGDGLELYKRLYSIVKKLIFIQLIICLTISSYSQSIQHIDSLVLMIDRAKFSDSIIVGSYNSSGNMSITGYRSNDAIEKIEVEIDNAGSYIIYLWQFKPTLNQLIFVRERCNQRESQYYFCGDTIIMDSKKHYIYESDTIFELINKYGHFQFLIEMQIIDNLAEHYTFTGILVEVPKGLKSCGGILPSGAAFKYEIVETDFQNYSSKYVIINTACPPLYGKNFFVTGSKYKINAATNNGASHSIMISSEYSKEAIPEFWARKIEKIE